ncbi:MAG: hypothetical protein ABIK68_15775 [bacterium]
MTPEISSFQQQMNSNRMAAFYTGQVVNGLNADMTQAFSDMLQSNLKRYVSLPDIRKQIDSSEDFTVQLRAVMDFFPSFFLVIANDLNSLPGVYQSARRLMMAGIFFITHRTVTHQAHIQLFVDSLQLNPEMNFSGGSDDDPDPELQTLPEVVYQDFLSIAKNQLRFQATKSSPELIENLFCLAGLSQIFLKYFTDLFAAAGNDRISQQINIIFSRLFITLRLEEIRYWKGFKNGNVLKSRLESIVEANSPKMRHPKLQKGVFSGLANYNPMIHNGTSRGFTATTQSVLKGQLTMFHAFSVGQQTLLLNIVHRFKGDDYVIYLLSQIIKVDRNRLLALNTYLESLQQNSLQGLAVLVGSFVRRFFPDVKTADSGESPQKAGAAVQYSDTSSRLSVAKKNLEALKDRKGMMTHDKVTQYLAERLKRLYERVKKTGALTQDMIPGYLAKFAQAAESFLVEVSPSRQQELIEAFEASTDEILEEITRYSSMSQEEVQVIRSGIHEKMVELDTPDLDRRTEVVEQIGLTLADVSDKVDPPQPPKGLDVTTFLKNQQVSIGFEENAPLLSLDEFFKLPFGDRKGPPEENWFESHQRYLELAVEKKKLEGSVLEALPEILPQLPRQKYRKYFNIFPNGEYADPTCSAVYDIWKSSALERLKI